MRAYVVLQIASRIVGWAWLPSRVGLSLAISIYPVLSYVAGAKTYHHHACQVRVDALRVLPTHGRGSTLSPSSDASLLFGQLRSIRTADFEFEHRFAKFDFAEEEEACVTGGVRLAVVGGFGGDVGLEISGVSMGCNLFSMVDRCEVGSQDRLPCQKRSQRLELLEGRYEGLETGYRRSW